MTKMETIFPVVFFDGERETSIGNVVVYPSLNYKAFLSILSLKIGISPNQFSVYLADGESSRKVPVTSKANFSEMSREKDSCFLVVLRRSRDSRARRQRRKADHYQRQQQQQPPLAGNVMLLKRNNNDDFNNTILRNYDRYYNINDDYNINGGDCDVLVCEECVRAKETGREVGFHWCVYDAVTFGFRSPAGPIARPVKG
ncbi:hypothetical protein CICLE_v10012818mg [Citrus x clementina]|uniref:DUF7138 domain-containing protein n=2 Tax=Citrus TaxID=2706 RepID=V4UUI5_CITCL|nr:hypothetical protein CICLE_v10012818mg [Citrus x clementina]